MIDASKKVTPEGLALLGWVPGVNGGWFYTTRRTLMGYYTPLFSGGILQWRFDGQNVHGKLAPRTLAEVKFLMDRMMEDD